MGTATLNFRDGASAGTLIDDAENTINWDSPSQLGNLMINVGSDAVRVGSNAIEVEFKATGVKGARYNMGSGVDFSGDRRLYLWIWLGTVDVVDTVANGGIRVYAEDTSNNWGMWTIGGSDSLTFGTGGYRRIAINLNKTPNFNSGTRPSASAIQYVGAAADVVTTLGKAAGMYIDQLHYGTHLEVTGGTDADPVTEQDIVDADTTGLGFMTKNRFDEFEVLSHIMLGDESGPTNSVFKFAGTVWAWGDNNLGPNDNKLETTQDTGTTKLILGNTSGTGDNQVGFGGIVMYAVGNNLDTGQFDRGYRLEFSNDIDTLTFYGSSFLHAQQGMNFGNSAGDHEVVDCTMSGGGLLGPSQVTIKKGFFNDAQHDKQRFQLYFISEDAGVLTNEHTEIRDATANDVTLLPASPPAASDRGYVGGQHQWSAWQINVGTAGAGTYTISFEYSTGQGTWASLTVTDGTNSFKNSGALQVAITTFPSDWVKTFVNNEGPYYWIRYTRDGGTQTTQPLGTQGFLFQVDEGQDGAASLFTGGAGGGMKSLSFISNNDDRDGFPRAGIEHLAAGTVTYDDLRFANNDFDIRLDAEATERDSYAFFNGLAAQWGLAVANLANDAVSQSFNSGAGGTVSRVRVLMYRSGTPTGNAFAEIYAHSGVFGTSSVPTGNALATSNPVDLSTLNSGSGNRVPVDFEFKDQFALTSTTDYCLVIRVDGGTLASFGAVGRDATAPTHGGNAATRDFTSQTWTASASDMPFKLNVDGILVVDYANAVDPSNNASTYEVYADVKGTVVINDNILVQVTVKDIDDESNIENARVLLEAAAGGDLPAEDSVTITSSGTTATVSHTAHGMVLGEKIVIRGANEPEYNGIFTIFAVSVNQYSYTMSGDPVDTATGTITATGVILDGSTPASGIVEETNFRYTSDQPVTGRARKGTASPFYKTGKITGTITNQGLERTVFLIRDE